MQLLNQSYGIIRKLMLQLSGTDDLYSCRGKDWSGIEKESFY